MSKASPRKTSASSKRKPVNKQNPVAMEVRHLATAALGILLFISVYVDKGAGMLGEFVRGVAVGLFGFGAYVLPVAVIALSVYALFSSARKVPSRVTVEAGVFFWCALAVCHISVLKEMPRYSGVLEYFSAAYRQGAPVNGGFFGAVLGNLLRGLLGTPGAYIALIAGGLIVLVLITGRTFTYLIPKAFGSARAYINSARDARYYSDEPESESTITPPVRAEQPKPAPRRAKVSGGKDDPLIFNINDDERTGREPKRVILIKEELEQRRTTPGTVPPRGAARVKPKSAVIDIHTREPVEEDPTFSSREFSTSLEPSPKEVDMEREGAVPLFEDTEAIEDMDSGIMVKGLVEQPDGDDWDVPPFDLDEDPNPVSGKNIIQLPTALNASRKRGKSEPVSIPMETSRMYEGYQLPPVNLLTQNQTANLTESRAQILENSRILEETLRSFRVEAKVVEVSVGPTVTRYDLSPGPGVKVAAIANLSNDLALSLAAQGIRIEAPIPGKAAVGIEIPNKEPQPVLLREIIEDDSFKKFPSRLTFAIGKDIAGNPVVTDVARMPHLLIAGATGSGKSVCINTLITSLLYKSRPDEVKLLMVDPKVVELSVYNGIPHLLIPVVTDPKKAAGALQWAVAEMEKRYALFAQEGVRDLKGYNALKTEEGDEENFQPQIVIIIDELADLMMTCKGEVEEAICRLAQKARAAGIHLIVATQRPSVDVITGLIKANIPSRLAFAVSSGIDSRTVLDMYGAEKLLGKGDMLFLPPGQAKPIRLQGGFISDKEVESVVGFLKAQQFTEYTEEMIAQVTAPAGKNGSQPGDEDLDEYFTEAVEFLIEKGKASTTLLQKRFRIGYNRASRLMDDLEARGIVGPEDGVKPRKILITYEEYVTDYAANV